MKTPAETPKAETSKAGTAPRGAAADATPPVEPPTTVLPGLAAPAGPPRRLAAPRTTAGRPSRATDGAGRPAPARSRRAKLTLQRIDPWSVFQFTLVASLFLGVALLVAVAALYAVLSALGVLGSVNDLYVEVVGGSAGQPLFTVTRILGGGAVLAAVNVLLLTLIATLGAFLYNLCTSFTGGIEVTLGEREA